MLELIQNADDNAYAEGVHPTLAFLPGARRTGRRPFPVHPWVGPPLDNRRMLVTARGRISFRVPTHMRPLSLVSDGGVFGFFAPPPTTTTGFNLYPPCFWTRGGCSLLLRMLSKPRALANERHRNSSLRPKSREPPPPPRSAVGGRARWTARGSRASTTRRGSGSGTSAPSATWAAAPSPRPPGTSVQREAVWCPFVPRRRGAVPLRCPLPTIVGGLNRLGPPLPEPKLGFLRRSL